MNKLNVGDRLFLIMIYEGILKSFELIIVGFENENEECVIIASDRDGDRYDIYETEVGTLQVDDEYISADHIISVHTNPLAVVVEETEFLDNREEIEGQKYGDVDKTIQVNGHFLLGVLDILKSLPLSLKENDDTPQKINLEDIFKDFGKIYGENLED